MASGNPFVQDSALYMKKGTDVTLTHVDSPILFKNVMVPNPDFTSQAIGQTCQSEVTRAFPFQLL